MNDKGACVLRITTAAVQTNGREALRIIQQPDGDREKHTYLTIL
jgi:hypothetical protein